MKAAEVSALRDFLDPSVFELLFTDSNVPEALSSGAVARHLACPSEFKKSTEKDLKYLQELNTNSNTAMSTQTWLRRFSKWAGERGRF